MTIFPQLIPALLNEDLGHFRLYLAFYLQSSHWLEISQLAYLHNSFIQVDDADVIKVIVLLVSMHM